MTETSSMFLFFFLGCCVRCSALSSHNSMPPSLLLKGFSEDGTVY